MSKQRRIYLMIFLLILGIFATARALTPNHQGFGTHTQLGLPPCPFYAVTRHRCPTCGVTTSLAHVMDGELAMAWWTHPLGPIVAGGLLGAAMFALARLWR